METLYMTIWPEYEYVDITYDRYEWRRKGVGKAQEKIKVGNENM